MRKAQAGTEFPQRIKTVTVPAVGIGASADVVIPADAAFIGIDAVQAMPTDALEANLVLAGIWVSNPATGELTIRFHATTIAVAGGNQDFLIVAYERDS